MDGPFYAQIRPGMAIEDADGDSVGEIAEILQPTQATVAPAGIAAAVTQAVMKVDNRGWLGLGSTLYIPVSAVRDVSGERVILVADESQREKLGWDQKPAWVND